MAAKRKADDIVLQGSHRNCVEPVRLPYTLVDGRQIRFIMMHSNKSFHISSNFSQIGYQPLFLGTDVLAGIKQETKNHTRIHARFATQGLATKLVFTDVRLDGINNSGAVWFYGLQGMFQAVFEYHSLSVQRHCLEYFTNVWLRVYSESPLEDVYPVTPANIILHPDVDQDPSVQVCCPLQAKLDVLGSDPLAEVSSLVEISSNSVQSCSELIRKWYEELNSLRKENHEYYLRNSRCDTNQVNAKLVQSAENDAGDIAYDSSTVQLECVASVVDCLQRSLDCMNTTTELSLFTHLLELSASVLESSSRVDRISEDCFGLSPGKLAALNTLSRWLGEEFRKLEPAIAKRVLTFKEQHINSIDNLPPAEQVALELFPPCMVQLISAWIGLTELHSADSLQMDHNYGHKQKSSDKPPGQNRNLFPIIQLILEFANNALGSGPLNVESPSRAFHFQYRQHASSGEEGS